MTINVSLNDLVNLQNENTAVTQINQNSSLIETAFLSALDTIGDKMQGTLDMNSNQVLNLPVPATAQSPLRLTDLTNIPAGGSAGDALIKVDNADYNVEWSPNSVEITAGVGISVSGSTVSLTTPVSMGNGGIGVSLNPVAGAVVFSASGNLSLTQQGLAGQVLQSQGATSPIWISAATGLVLAGTGISVTGTTPVLISVSSAPASALVLTDITTLSNLASVGTVTTGTWNAAAISSAAGTLTGITLNGTVVSSSLAKVGTITTGVWNATAISSAAGTLTGTTLAGNVLSSSLASVGTVTTGIWNATPIAGANGGLGITTAVIGDVLYASATAPTWSRLADVSTGSVLISGGLSTAPAWSGAPRLSGNAHFTVVNGTGSGFWLDALTTNSATTGNPDRFFYGSDALQADTFRIFSALNGGNIISVVASMTSNANAVSIAGSITTSAPVYLPKYTVTSLPSAATGAIAVVTDALAPTFLGALTGGGTTKSLVVYNGSTWVAA
jgi:uncharacterized membrane protein YiaA